MEVKTTTQIFNDCIEGLTHSPINEDIERKWVDVEQLIKWIQSRQIGGMGIAKTDFLKGQKNGELMMLRKMYDAITSTSHNTDYDSESEKDSTPQGDIEQSSTSHNQ